jgi:hypothetical protein
MNAHYCLARQVGRIPIHCKEPAHPDYAKPQSLPEIDPFAWHQIHGYEVCSLEQAVQNALTAAQKKRSRTLEPFRKKWWKLRSELYNPERKWFRYSEAHTPTNPLFWKQLGHNPAHARRLIRCCPEYWFYRQKCSWRWAVVLATSNLKRLAHRFKTHKKQYYEFAETTEYDIAERDPVHWFMEGCDWNEAVVKIIKKVFRWPQEGCEKFLQIRDLLRKAGPQSELLSDGAIHISGPLLGYQREYELLQKKRKNKALREGNKPEAPPRWGPLELHGKATLKAHCCAVGPAEEGTEVLLRILMQSVPNHRWLVFDGGATLFPAIKAIRPDRQLHLFNPLDARSSAWNIADDAASPQQAREIAATLFSADQHHDAILTESARVLLVAIIEALNQKAPGKWSLCDLISAAEPSNLPMVLLSNPATVKVYKALHTDPHAGLVSSLVHSSLQPLQPAAAAWKNASHKISIAEWLQSDSALILSNSFRYKHLLAPLNFILFRLIANRLMELRSVSSQNTWVFLSDLSQIGRLDSLSVLLSQGPSAGVTVALTLDDVEILQRHYGAETTGILGCCGNFAFLRITNPATARWASLLLGVAKVQLIYETEGKLSGKTSQGITITSAERPLVPPTAFQQLPLPKDSQGPVGYFKNLEQRAYKGQIDLEHFLKNHWLSKPDADQSALVPCPEEHLLFPEDTAAVLAELGFSPVETLRKLPTRPPTTPKSQRKLKRKKIHTEIPQTTEFDPDDFPRLEPRIE